MKQFIVVIFILTILNAQMLRGNEPAPAEVKKCACGGSGQAPDGKPLPSTKNIVSLADYATVLKQINENIGKANK